MFVSFSVSRYYQLLSTHHHNKRLIIRPISTSFLPGGFCSDGVTVTLLGGRSRRGSFGSLNLPSGPAPGNLLDSNTGKYGKTLVYIVSNFDVILKLTLWTYLLWHHQHHHHHYHRHHHHHLLCHCHHHHQFHHHYSPSWLHRRKLRQSHLVFHFEYFSAVDINCLI